MTNKRKGKSQPHGESSYSRAKGQDESRLAINTYEDVADSEDEFHINRDKVLLEEGPAQKKQRIAQEQEAFFELSDEEVLAASEEEISESEDGLEDAREDYEDLSLKSKSQKLGKPIQDSESETSTATEEPEDIGGWGTSRKDYYNADVIETEADALEEEAEARRLQQKQLQSMTEADFGFDEVDWLEGGKDGKGTVDGNDDGKVIREVLPKLEVTDAMGPEERMRILRIRYPEFEPLAKEFVELQILYEDLKLKSAAAEKLRSITTGDTAGPIDLSMPVVVVKHRALNAYLSALSMYFALLTSGTKGQDGKTTAMPPEQLRDHSVMDTLVQCRDLWSKVKDIEMTEPALPTSNGHAASEIAIESTQVQSQMPRTDEAQDVPKKRKHRKSKSQRLAEAAQAEAETRRLAQIQETEASLADLASLTAPSKFSKTSKTTAIPSPASHDSDSDIGDQTALTPAEAAEKAKRKKSLRFYTSQIAQKSNKRDAAGREAGGDADLPYRERLKDRQARLNAEAEKRGEKGRAQDGAGEELGGESDEDDQVAARELRDAGSGSEDYYDLVSSRTAKKKEAKAALSALQAQAKAEGGVVRVVEDDAVGEDGKRAISYSIEKNKGLAPRRKKDVRNPRLKKRKKFEEKKKKLASMKPVYKGGEGRGGYAGELTGIKKGLVRGVRL
ncbi:MAG: hypothetical protein Q9217_000900 [Psora testacea]